MDDLTNTPGPDGLVNQVGRGQIPTLKIFGMEIPLPPWAVSIVAAVVIIAVAVTLVFTIMHYRDDRAEKKEIRRQKQELQAERETVEKQKKDLDMKGEEFKESYRHLLEQPEPVRSPWPNLSFQLYRSDGCVWVIRRTRHGLIPRWFPDPSKISPPPRPEPEEGVVRGASLAPGLTMPRSESPVPPQALAQPIAFSPAPFHRGGQMALAQPGSDCKRRCQNPHPGEFSSWEGERDGCWVKVWRQWRDGCTHYQWFNICYSYWDSDERGQPRVYWTCCKH